MNDVNKNNNKISKTFDINNKNEKEKESFYEKIKKKFFNFVFNDSDILVKLLYHKYFYICNTFIFDLISFAFLILYNRVLCNI